MERRAIRLAVLIFTIIVLLSALFGNDSIYDWCFPDEAAPEDALLLYKNSGINLKPHSHASAL